MANQNNMNNFIDSDDNKNKNTNNINNNSSLLANKSFQNFFSCISLKISNSNNNKNKSPKISTSETSVNQEELKQKQENFSFNSNQLLESASIRQRMPYLNLPYGNSGLNNLQKFFSPRQCMY